MKWGISEYNEWIKNGRPINDEVLILNISHSDIKSLEGIGNLTNLREFYCYSNQLTSLEGIETLTKLKWLSCSINKLTSLKGIETLTNLQKLHCYKNQLTSLKGIETLINLKNFNCSHNQLISLKGIETLTNLQELYCEENQLTSLNELINLRNLRGILYYDNPIEHIPPNIRRIINGSKKIQNIYNDAQSIHNHNIQECIKHSITNILNFEPTITNLNQLILDDIILTPQTKEILIDYCNNKDVHSVLNITFEELLLYVFNRIEINEHKDEIKKILNIEMLDSMCKCFTGRISRLINCLSGFDDLVNIKISDNEQIGQIIALIREQLEAENKYTIDLHKEIAMKELSERGYTEDKIKEWIEYIE